VLLAEVIPGGLGAFALIVAAVIVALILLLVWLLSRDRDVTRTSFGFYVERRRFDAEPEPQPAEEQTLPWPAVPQKEEP
jgi:hypothetical protein